ncbi:hypothetical protein V6N13_001519 [Hibiscus sabdariffa]|uniref:Uncharacterized protein n=1 Tax=Hibiscus sabdariffa TaxID=183260 RepID=A0ABR2G8R9_9ROSI
MRLPLYPYRLSGSNEPGMTNSVHTEPTRFAVAQLSTRSQPHCGPVQSSPEQEPSSLLDHVSLLAGPTPFWALVINPNQVQLNPMEEGSI